MQDASTKRGNDLVRAKTGYTYGAGSAYALGSPLTVRTENWLNGNGQPTSLSTNTYIWRDGAVQSVTAYKPNEN